MLLSTYRFFLLYIDSREYLRDVGDGLCGFNGFDVVFFL